MPVPVIAAGIGGLASIAGGFLGGKPKTSTQTSSTTPTLTPEMQALQGRLTAYSDGLMTNPEQGIAPIRTAALDNINRSYMDIPSRLSSKFASRGYGSSGDFGNTLYQTEFQRGGAISDLEGKIAEMVNSNRNYGASLGERLLNSGKGSSSTGTSTGPDTSMSDGLISTGNGFSNIATLLTLSKLLKGGGSGSSGGGSGSYDWDPGGDWTS